MQSINYIDILTALVLAAIFYCLLTIGALIYQTNKARIFPKIGIKQNNSVKSATEKETPAPVVKQRLRSLDTFRGYRSLNVHYFQVRQ